MYRHNKMNSGSEAGAAKREQRSGSSEAGAAGAAKR